jgi:hypothetical protein
VLGELALLGPIEVNAGFGIDAACKRQTNEQHQNTCNEMFAK